MISEKEIDRHKGKEITLDMLGSDPEFFLYNKKDKQVVSAINKIGGDKNSPLPLSGGYILEDNVTAEINPLPGRSKEEFIHNIVTIMNGLYKHLEGLYDLYIKDTHLFKETYLLNIGPKAFESGCDPFKSIYAISEEEEYENIISLIDMEGWRYAGGHLHLSFKNPEDVDKWKLINLLDFYINNPIKKAMAPLPVKENTRYLSPYGKSGLYRDKIYGFEYRSPSNLWLRNEETIGWIWDSVLYSISIYNMGKTYNNNNPPPDPLPFPITRNSLFHVGDL